MAKDHTSTLVHEIEETRERLAGTIDELLVRSNPKNIAARQVDAVKSKFIDSDSGKPNLKTIGAVVGGIVIPATAAMGARRLSWSKVVAVGPHARAVEVGDRVLFDADDKAEVEVAGDVYVVMRERDVHAVAADRVAAESTGLYL